MRRVAQCLTALLFLPAALTAQKPKSSEKAVLSLENDWTRALVRNDAGIFRKLLAPKFIYTEDNAIMTGDEMLKGMAASGDVVTSAWNEEMKFYDYTPAGVVTGILNVKGHNGNKPFFRRYRFTDTWFMKNGKWQIIAAQDYLIPK